MLQIRTGVRPEEVRAGGEHVLFVEGSEDGSLDQAVLRVLLSRLLRIETMGPSYSVRSAAQALSRHHPRYYFLIDRDHYDDGFVERCWRNFPDPDTDNLIVWRRREIENYFLDPLFLVESAYCHANERELMTTLIQAAQERLFLDVANYVISSVREEQKSTWIEHFSNPADFASKSEAVGRLTSASAFGERSRRVSSMVSKGELTDRFENGLAMMTGGEKQLAYGSGRWVEMIRGKKVFSRLLNSGGFEVEDASGQQLTGNEKAREIVKELAARDVESRPADFVDLRRLIEDRVSGT